MKRHIKFLLFFVALCSVFVFGGVFLDAYFAIFIVTPSSSNIEIKSLEPSSISFDITIDPTSFFYNDFTAEAYGIDKFSHCNQYDENFDCMDQAPDLCPYISFESTEGEATDLVSVGELHLPADTIDRWKINILAPCFEGECPAGYSGVRLSQAQKDKTFKCDVYVETTNIPVLVKNISPKTAYAQTFPTPQNKLEISAVIKSQPKLTPVIIVPGIAGSELYNWGDLIWPDLTQMLLDNNDQFLTEGLLLDENGNSLKSITVGNVVERIPEVPIFDVNIFEGLRQSLEVNNYVLSDSMFFFPYDWRLNLDDTKDLLNQKIEEIKSQTGSDKVDIIAHSMGGLLTKDYINQYGKDSIDKLIFVGTPHLGAPKAAKIILEGDRMGIPVLEEDRVQEIVQNSPAAYELLPSQSYFNNLPGYINSSSFFGESYYDYDKTRDFLIQEGANNNIFSQAESFFGKNLQDLDFSGIDTYNIAGCKTPTQSAYRLDLFDNIGRVGYSTGDETVPLGSADYINIPSSNKFYVRYEKHSELPSVEDVRSTILDILNGEAVSTTPNFNNDSAFCGVKGKITSWYSPVEVHIYSEGKHTGPIENNAIEYGIPGVDYDIIGEKKFIFLPTEEGQQYNIEADGTGSGTFDLLISENENGEVIETKVFNDVSVSTATNVKFSISDLTSDEVILVDQGIGLEPVGADATISGDESGDVTLPTTSANKTGAAGLAGWYRGDVKVELDVVDDNSGILETRYSLDGESFLLYGAPIVITQEGTTTLKYFSVDRAGNNEEIKTVEIKIDKTAPEINSNFDGRSKTFIFSSQDDISCAQKRCVATDEAGNTTEIKFEKIKLGDLYTLSLKSVSYNGGAEERFPDNVLIVHFEEKKGVIKKLTQSFLMRKQQILFAEYNPKKNETLIISLKKDGGFSRQVMVGVKTLVVNSNKGKLETMVK